VTISLASAITGN